MMKWLLILFSTLSAQIIGGERSYYQFQNIPSYGQYEFGYHRGNPAHHITRHEKAANWKFKTKVKWYDHKGGWGEHYFDYNHVDEGKGWRKSFGHGKGGGHGYGKYEGGHGHGGRSKGRVASYRYNPYSSTVYGDHNGYPSETYGESEPTYADNKRQYGINAMHSTSQYIYGQNLNKRMSTGTDKVQEPSPYSRHPLSKGWKTQSLNNYRRLANRMISQM